MMKKLLGLIGYPLSHSFSKEYFRGKFDREGISGYEYELFPLENITELPSLLNRHPQLAGLNVTIPHKVNVLPYLRDLDETAAAIGAVNTIKITNRTSDTTGTFQDRVLTGYNTDAYGFQTSLEPLLRSWHKKALILGTGGASRAVLYVLQRLGIDPVFVSRRPAGRTSEADGPSEKDHGVDRITYEQLDAAIMQEYPLIVNTTPLGTYPDTERCPALPYEALSERNLLYDLVYNPAETLFMKKGKERGAATINGLEMLRLQAEKAWEIWTT